MKTSRKGTSSAAPSGIRRLPTVRFRLLTKRTRSSLLPSMYDTHGVKNTTGNQKSNIRTHDLYQVKAIVTGVLSNGSEVTRTGDQLCTLYAIDAHKHLSCVCFVEGSSVSTFPLLDSGRVVAVSTGGMYIRILPRRKPHFRIFFLNCI